MIPREIIKKIRRIQITTSRKVTDVFAGQYQSVFKGMGIEFDEVREYIPGDEIRAIDWNVTARMGKPFVKQFIEERELTIMLLLDVSKSCRFGTGDHLKSELAAEVCSALAFSAIRNNDKVGMITFTDRVETFVPPRKGVKHVLRVIREALYNKPEGITTDINAALEYLSGVMTRKAIVFVVSDFVSPDFKKMLSITNKRHDVIAVNISDPAEEDLPDAGIVKMHDAEAGYDIEVDTSSKSARAYYKERAIKAALEKKKVFRSAKVDSIDLSTGSSYVEPLIKFFKMRERRKLR